MGEAWYEGLSEDVFITEKDKIYEKAAVKIREGLALGLDFDSACEAIEVEDEILRKAIIDDMLKVIIAEEHFAKEIPLDDLSKKLKISMERLETAKQEMLEDVKDASIKAFYKGLRSGNA
ncbi:MAG: hypothetical protein AB1632_02975 [Nitrospirota bacterium]